MLKLATVAAYLSLENLKLHNTCFLESIVCPGLQAHNFKTMRLLRLYIIFCCLVVSLLLALRLLEAQWWQSKGQSQVAVPVTSFAGCYELKLGRWWPWSFGGDNEFVTPSSKIELLPVQNL